jgi:glucose-6-phosphate isomerase
VATLPELLEWVVLGEAKHRVADTDLRHLFDQDPKRPEIYSLEGAGVHLDFSRQRLDDDALEKLWSLARAADVPGWTARLYAGEKINGTEDRAALHMALRGDGSFDYKFAGESVMPMVLEERQRLLDGVAHARAEGRIKDVICIGIGGSHLGPELVVRALETKHKPDIRCHFVPNIDPLPLKRLMERLDAKATLVIVTSKTFTTQETMHSAVVARAWLERMLGAEQAKRHLVAVTAAPEVATAWGVPERQVYRFWDWVGGRYSVWSSVGMPIALAFGEDAFTDLLEGAAEMDAHFKEAELGENLPTLMALLQVWYTSAWGAQSHAVVPYREGLGLLPMYQQQLEMESNGKGITRDGDNVGTMTAPVIWGTSGTNAQHSYFQLLHQGTHLIPVDFILAPDPESPDAAAERMLAANALAQADALAFGSDPDSTGPVTSLCPGNRPSSVIVLEKFDAKNIGRLIALYEHKTFAASCLWDVNAFDQPGVEIGKRLAKTALKQLEGSEEASQLALRVRKGLRG